jgi:hypothetical protein
MLHEFGHARREGVDPISKNAAQDHDAALAGAKRPSGANSAFHKIATRKGCHPRVREGDWKVESGRRCVQLRSAAAGEVAGAAESRPESPRTRADEPARIRVP